MVDNSFVGRAMGILVAQQDGLRSIHVAADVEPEVVRAIVSSANQARGRGDYAFAVSDDRGEDNAYTASEAIRFRQGDHLAVVRAGAADLASFDSVFRVAVGETFPYPRHQHPDLQDVAEGAAAQVALACGLAGRDDATLARFIVRVAEVLYSLYEGHSEGPLTWSVAWMRHFDQGLGALQRVLTQTQRGESHTTMEHLLQSSGDACFGLPRGFSATGSTPPRKEIEDAVESYWGDADAARSALAAIADARGHDDFTRDHLEVGWEDLGQEVAACGDVILALQRWAVREPSAGFLTAVSVGEFLDPLAGDRTPAVLEVRDTSGRLLPVVGDPAHGSALVTMGQFDDPANAGGVGPALQVLVTGASGTGVTLKAKGAHVDWVESGREDLGDDLLLHGRLQLRPAVLERREPNKLGALLTVEASRSVLRSWHPRQVWVLPAGDQPGLALIPLGAGGKAKKPEWVILPSPVDHAGLVDRHEVSTPAPSVAVLVSGDRPPSADVSAEFHAVGDDWWTADVDTRSALTVSASAGGVDVSVLLVPATKGGSEQSPLVAAATGRARDAEGPSGAVRESLRWRAETVMGREALEGLDTCCGRIVLASDEDSALEHLGSTDAPYNWDQREDWWSRQPSLIPRPDFVNGPEATGFRAAFNALGLGGYGLSAEDPISRTALASLVRESPGSVDALLVAFRRMVDAAAQVDAATLFWAAYPFSITVWDTRQRFSAEAVLLSPLHPIRLAWLASLENELEQLPGGRQRQRLAGTIAGWDLPLMGPADVDMGWMAAVAMDPGEDQLFVGWSALARGAADRHDRLQLPVRAGRYYLPGSSSTGLTASAVDAAVADYTRLHPHVTTLSVDLPATEDTPRSVEVDAAVVAASSRWLRKVGADEGGVRVLDSNLRKGPIPRDEISTTFRNLSGAAFSWERYATAGRGGQQSCNLRILQESGTTLQFARGEGPNFGHLGQIPFRRYWVQEGTGGGTRYAGLTEAAAQGAFGKALASLERANLHPRLEIRLEHRDFLGAEADWVVTGEAFLAPTELDGLLRTDQGHADTVLWEWRPPLLTAASTSVVGRRPFVTIARIPQSFKDRLGQLVAAVTSAENKETWTQRIIEKLGAQGVGLSSLLGLGGNHAVGAFGFYFAFACLDQLQGEDAFDVVVPIDACAEFLRALTDETLDERNTRRADLLGMRFDAEGLTLVPIEIKMYGFDDEARTLPRPGSAALDEAIDQLRVTSHLLDALVDESREASPLWWNALASLVEAGFRLRSGRIRAGTGAEFQKLIDGRQDLRVGEPLLFYFQGQPSADGSAYRVFEDRDALVFTADARTVTLGLSEAPEVSGGSDNPWGQDLGRLVRSSWAGTDHGAARVATPLPAGAPLVNESGVDESASPDASPETPESNREVASAGAGQSELSPSTETHLEHDFETNPRSEGNISSDLAAGDGTKLHLGDAVDTLGRGPVYFWPGNTALSQMNVGVVGDLGTGKTQFLKTLIHELRWKTRDVQGFPASFLIFDYKRDYQQQEFLDAVGGVVLQPRNIPLDVLKPVEDSPSGAYQQGRKFVDVLQKIYAGIGPRQASRVTRIVREWFIEHGRTPLLGELLEAYQEDAVDSVTSILETFVYSDVFAVDRSEMKSFEELMDGKVVVVALNELGTDQNAKNALVALFLNLYYEYMLRARKWPFSGEDPQLRTINSFLLVDEAHNIMQYEFPIVESLLLQGREFGFGVVLASQYLNHFKPGKTNYGEPLQSWFIHKVPQVRERDLRDLGIVDSGQATADRISTLENHRSYVKTYGAEGVVMHDRAFFSLDKVPFDEAHGETGASE